MTEDPLDTQDYLDSPYEADEVAQDETDEEGAQDAEDSK